MTRGHRLVAKLLAISQASGYGNEKATVRATLQIPKIDVLLKALCSEEVYQDKAVFVTFKTTTVRIKEDAIVGAYDKTEIKAGIYDLGPVIAKIHAECCENCVHTKFNRRLVHVGRNGDYGNCADACFGDFDYPRNYLKSGDFYGLLLMLKQYTESANIRDCIVPISWLKKYRRTDGKRKR